ncbi:HemY protein [Gammaproteobacteria bacterium]
MRRIIIYFLALLSSVWFGIIMYRNPGYVLVSYQGWSVETTLWFAVVVLILLFLLFYMLLRFSSGVNSITIRLKQWVINRRKLKARAQTVLGLYDFAEGNWGASEKKLIRGAKYSDMPLINYLAAAFMAQQQHALARRDNYLLIAQRDDADHPMVVSLTQARLQIFNQQWEEALATLQRLHQLQPKNAFILQLLEQAYFELKDWVGLKVLLPDLRKRRAFSIEEINQLELKVYSELLLVSRINNTIEVKWGELPGYLRKYPAIVAIYVEHLLANKECEEAEAILKMALHKVLDERLLELYAMLPSSNPIKKVARAEGWLKENPENSALLLCLGRICKQQKLWGKARQYLEKSACLTKAPAVYLELGQIMEMQNDLRGALDSYSKGLQAAGGRKI